MGNETNFNPDVLNQALTELQQLSYFIENDQALKRIQSAGSITGDLTGLDQKASGWIWLERHISEISSYVSHITQAINTESTNLQARMNESLKQLNGAEDHNKSGLDSSNKTIQSGSNAGVQR